MKNTDNELNVKAEKLVSERFEALGINKSVENHRKIVKDMISIIHAVIYSNDSMVNKSGEITMF